MTIDSIAQIREKIQVLVDSHPEHLQEAFLSCDASHEDCAAIKKDYEQKVNPYRQLHIGIVGRVKAGKSSLLNSLFFNGKDVLPKAATPMTAALTKLYYSEKLTVKINFFEQSDIDELEKASARYEKLLKEKTNEELNRQIEIFKKRNNADPVGSDMETIKEKAERQALNSLKSTNLLLVGEAEQYRMYKNSSSDVKSQLGKPIVEYPADIYSIGAKLSDYVGANGKYTGITSNVEIGFPNEALKEITVVDTPGFDDPVPSRDALARDALKICDAIFVLSPAGSFCNAEDKVNIVKIEKGEGIQEIFVVASQIDSALRSPEYKGKDIPGNLKSITESISKTLRDMADGIRKDANLSASHELVNRLYENSGTNLLFTSGMCQALYENWDDEKNWNEEHQYLFTHLNKFYPEYFSSRDDTAKEMLKIIGNVSVIKEKINDVRARKDEILKKREDEYLSVKYLNLKDMINLLSDTIKSQKSNVETSDIGELKKAQQKQNECLDNLKGDFIEAFEAHIDEFTNAMSDKLQGLINEFYSDKKSEMKHAEDSESRTETYTVQVPYTYQVKIVDGTGFLNMITFGAFGNHTETRTGTRTEDRERNYQVHTVNAHAVTDAIRDFADNIGLVLENNVSQWKLKFKGDLKSSLMDIWSKYEVVEYCSSSSRNIQAAQIINLLPDVTFNAEWNLPKNLSRSGKLEDDDAYEFESQAADALSALKRTYSKQISEFVVSIKNSLKPISMADNVLQKMKNDIEKLSSQIEDKQKTLDHFARILNEIDELKKDVENEK